eukprot:62889-Prymnesium_polylepis.1
MTRAIDRKWSLPRERRYCESMRRWPHAKVQAARGRLPRRCAGSGPVGTCTTPKRPRCRDAD